MKSRERRKNIFSTLFLAPAFLLYTGLMVVSIFFTIRYSLLDWGGLGKSTFIGLENFVKLFKDNAFKTSFINTMTFVLVAVLAQNIFGLVFAYFVAGVKKGYSVFRAVFFVPVIINAVAVALMFTLFYTGDGPLNTILRTVGLGGLIKSWLSDKSTVLICIMIPEIWQYAGTYFMIHLAGIQGLPADVIECAKIDGANGPTILTKVVIPMMSEVIQVGILYSFINALKTFTYSWIMTKGGPGTVSSYISVFMYTRIFQKYKYGYGSAVAVVLLIAIAIITIIFKGIFDYINRDDSGRA